MISSEMYLTNSIVKRLLGLRPILDLVPEIKSAVDSMPATVAARKPGCGKCGKHRTGATIASSAAKTLAPIVMGLSSEKKTVILNVLGTGTLRGFLPSSGHIKSVILAQK